MTPIKNPAMPSVIDGSAAVEFRRSFNAAHFEFRHNLAGHPLFSTARLAELADRMTAVGAGHHVVAFTVTRETPARKFDQLARHEGARETLSRIETGTSWLKLSFVQEYDPQYRGIHDQILEEAADCSGLPLRQALRWSSMTILLSSPGIITPYHIDHEFEPAVPDRRREGGLAVRSARCSGVARGRDREFLRWQRQRRRFPVGGPTAWISLSPCAGGGPAQPSSWSALGAERQWRVGERQLELQPPLVRAAGQGLSDELLPSTAGMAPLAAERFAVPRLDQGLGDADRCGGSASEPGPTAAAGTPAAMAAVESWTADC